MGRDGKGKGKGKNGIAFQAFVFFLSLERANHRTSERGWLICMVFGVFFLASELFVLFPG
jgi:hypothetical protein